MLIKLPWPFITFNYSVSDQSFLTSAASRLLSSGVFQTHTLASGKNPDVKRMSHCVEKDWLKRVSEEVHRRQRKVNNLDSCTKGWRGEPLMPAIFISLLVVEIHQKYTDHMNKLEPTGSS